MRACFFLKPIGAQRTHALLPVAGRLQRMVGAFPHVMHFAIPLVEASGRRKLHH